MLRKDAHSAQGKMVAEATAPRRENVPRHILFYYDRKLRFHTIASHNLRRFKGRVFGQSVKRVVRETLS